jgi:hypothetical protein
VAEKPKSNKKKENNKNVRENQMNLSDPSYKPEVTKKSRASTLLAIQDSKQVTVWYAVFTIIAIAVLLVGAVKPTATTIFSIIDEIEEKEKIVEDLDKKSQAISTLRAEYNNSLHNDLQSLSLIYPSRGDFSLITVNLDEICKRNNFELASISLESVNSTYDTTEPKQLSIMEPWQINLNVSGYKTNLIPFLKDLEESPMYPEIQSVNYTDIQDASGKTRFTIVIKVYKIDDPEFYTF